MGLFGKEKTAEEWSQKGEELTKLHKYDKAISCFKNALKIDYESGAVNGIGNAFAYKYNLEEADSWYDEAIRLDPNHSSTWSNKGINLGRLKQYEKALTCLDKSIQLDPNESHTWDSKGMILYFLNRYDEGIICLDEAIRLDPNNTNAQNNRKDLQSKIIASKQKIRKGWSESEKEEVRINQNGRCALCHKPPPRWEYDHIDGDRTNDRVSNCQGLCPNCHSVKTHEE